MLTNLTECVIEIWMCQENDQQPFSWPHFVFVFFLFHTSADLPFVLTGSTTGFCFSKRYSTCYPIRWTTGDRLLFLRNNKCLGVQSKSAGTEVNLFDCDENSKLQKWECRNETVLALKDEELYIELTADNTFVLSKTVGLNNHFIISATSSGACTRTYRGNGQNRAHVV